MPLFKYENVSEKSCRRKSHSLIVTIQHINTYISIYIITHMYTYILYTYIYIYKYTQCKRCLLSWSCWLWASVVGSNKKPPNNSSRALGRSKHTYTHLPFILLFVCIMYIYTQYTHIYIYIPVRFHRLSHRPNIFSINKPPESLFSKRTVNLAYINEKDIEDDSRLFFFRLLSHSNICIYIYIYLCLYIHILLLLKTKFLVLTDAATW